MIRNGRTAALPPGHFFDHSRIWRGARRRQREVCCAASFRHWYLDARLAVRQEQPASCL